VIGYLILTATNLLDTIKVKDFQHRQ